LVVELLVAEKYADIGRSFGLEIDGLNHAPPFADVGSKHCLRRFLIEVERLKAELLEPRRPPFSRGHAGTDRVSPVTGGASVPLSFADSV
jgi:hypothetical protein